MFEADREQIVARWKAAFGQYDEFRTAAEPAVVRWEWTNGGERYSSLPFFFQRFPGRARALKEPPAVKAQHIEYGLDDQGRPRVRRMYNYLEQAFEAFYRYDETLTEIVQFSMPPRIPIHVEQVVYDQGRVTRYASFRLNGYTPLYSQKGKDPDVLYEWLGPNGRFVNLEDYIYAGDRLTTIRAYREVPTGGSDPSFQFAESFSYDETGKLWRIQRVSSEGAAAVVYQKRAPGETFKSIRAAATQKMIAAVVERLRAAHITEKLCCVELSYRAVEHYFPPNIVLGPESHRQQLLDSGNPDARYYIFTPVLQAHPDNILWLEISDPDTLEACQRLGQEIQTGEKWTTATRILREVAAALTQYDWTGILDITPDFVVFAIDHEMDDLEAALRASATPEQIREWKKKGWL
jgi:hypothetical protein